MASGGETSGLELKEAGGGGQGGKSQDEGVLSKPQSGVSGLEEKGGESGKKFDNQGQILENSSGIHIPPDSSRSNVGFEQGGGDRGALMVPVVEEEENIINEIYFQVGNKCEIALVPTNCSSDEIKDLFRSAAEAGPCDIVKLYTLEGRLLNISPYIPPNTSSSPYRLEVVAVHCNGILMDQLGIDLLALDKRVCALEKILKNQGSPCDSIQELKEEVNQLRYKLENYEHLSWLGFYKALHPPPLPTPPRPAGVGYHKKSRDDKQAICDKFLRLCDVVLTRETCQLLREPTFDNWQWEDEEMLVLLQQMYLDLELPRKFDIEIHILRNFLVNVYHHYNDVPFHNFRHCFCVTQMMFGMACSVKLAERIGDLEVLILLTSCICHDLDHPGYNNIYQINAQTELALRYNDISPLENHHCSIAFRLLEDPECNIFRNLPVSTYRKIREGMIRCILATDMARHNDIVSQFREISPNFDYSNKGHINLLTMVLIKVADISNEARPMNVAEPWLDCLLAEFFQQSDTEKLEGLPVTPFMDRDKITKPSSQCSFIGFVLLPLFEALASFFPELEPLIIDPVKYALDYYRKLNEASQQANRHRKSTTEIIGINTQPSSTANSTPASGSTEPDGAPPLSPPAVLSSTSGKCTQFVASSPKVFNPSNDNSSNLCDNKVPSDPCSVNRVSRSNSVSMPSSTSHSDRVGGGAVRPDDQNQAELMMNPIAIAHRRASQLLIRGSGSVSSLKSALTTRSGPGYFTSFPSLESDSEREGETDEDEDAITEVAVSEKALKFKIATESSFDYTSISSRKGSRENKSESSGQSTSGQSSSQQTVGGSSGLQHNYNNNSILREEPAGSSTIVLSPRSSTPKLELSGVCCASAGGTDLTLAKLVTATASAGVEGVVLGRSSEGLAHHSGSSASTPVGEEGRGNVAGASGSPASGSQSTAAKSKAKESFFSRLKLFTDRLSSGGDGASGLGGSSSKVQSQGFNYFKRGGRKAGVGRNKSCVAHLDDRPCSSSSASIGGGGGGRKGKHRGSNSDPEGRDEFLRRHHTIHHTSEHYTQSEGERDYSELASPDCSPALSSRDSESYSRKGSSWKQCSGSLDSILSKEDSKRSPGRRLQMLPRFSSFVHKRTRMGFMRRLSPKNNTEPKS